MCDESCGISEHYMDNTTQLMGQQHDDARITAMARWLLETVPPVVVR